MFRSSSNFDKLLDKATSNLRLEPDWPTTLQICDLIRQGDVQPKYALAAIKKKICNSNPHIAMYGLQVLESCMKNCGQPIHDEVCTKQNMEFLRELAKTTTDNVKAKVLELIQAWAFAFRNSTKYRVVQDTLNIMKTEGYTFPTLKESDAMFSADTAPEWADGDCCHRCRTQFTVVQRKHHCRACGQVFCGQCSSKTSTVPKFGIEKEVRVCEACFESLSKPLPTAAGKGDSSSDLPAEYVNSSLAQQSQRLFGRGRGREKKEDRSPRRPESENSSAPPARRTEEELREEEELQLALALSQSEAEHKEKEKKRTAAMMSSVAATRAKQQSPPATVQEKENVSANVDEDMDPELARYLNRSLWTRKASAEEADKEREKVASPSAPAGGPLSILKMKEAHENGETDAHMEEFVDILKNQVEIFVNRMKSNSSRGRSIANDSSVQTLFLNITTMHSKLLNFIQEQDDSRVYYEKLQDKLTQVKDARAALDALREEHREKLRRQAEEAERIRQMQMAQKLEIMRKKKQQYLQYQRQLALQKIQEQEREMQMRQEQQKQQYLMGSTPYAVPYIPPGQQNYPGADASGSPAHGQFRPQGPMMPPGPYPQMVTQGSPYPQYAQPGVAVPSTSVPTQSTPHPMQMSQQGPVPTPGPPQGGPMHQMIRGPMMQGPVPMPIGPHGPIPMQHGPPSASHGPPGQMIPGPIHGPGLQGSALPGTAPPSGHMTPLGPQGGPVGGQMLGPGPQGGIVRGPVPQNVPMPGPPGGSVAGPGPQNVPIPGPHGGPMLGPGHQGVPIPAPGLQNAQIQGPVPQGVHMPGSGPGPMPNQQQFHPQPPTQSAPPGSPQQPPPSQSSQEAELISFD